ncbi:MAG TPA: 5,10-methylenetetrahydrofolate reductase [Candidatus Latescibacteria bacterium]|nr:5,10-methylenetetrahydrofolate reductase [Candidatus Latescibacterota bacterium]
MKLRELFEEGRFVLTSEIGPPKGVLLDEMFAEIEPLKGKVDAINVTDNQSSVMRLGSLPVCHILKERGFIPVFQITCRDRNRLALQSDILSAYVLGVENVLCITGDHNVLGDHPQSKPVFDLDSVQLIKTVRGLTRGRDMVGNELEGSPEFCIGAVVNPGADPLEPQIIKMELKAEAGAEFFQTQTVYDVGQFERFMSQVERLKRPVMAGIVFLKSAGMARFMNQNVAGVSVPDDIIKELASVSKEDRPKKSVEITARIIRSLKDMCQGVHLMPLGWDRYVPDVLKEADLR